MTAPQAHSPTHDLPPLDGVDSLLRVDIGNASPDTVIVQLFGEIDQSSRHTLVVALNHILDDWPQHIIIGLAHVSFIGSHGVYTLSAAGRTAAERDASFALVAPTPMTMRVLAITGLDKFIPVYPTMDRALAHI